MANALRRGGGTGSRAEKFGVLKKSQKQYREKDTACDAMVVQSGESRTYRGGKSHRHRGILGKKNLTPTMKTEKLKNEKGHRKNSKKKGVKRGEDCVTEEVTT